MRKKLFAVIMSAMMMITFMPTMAFAANYNYSKVKSWNDYVKATVEFVNAADSSDTFTKEINVGRTSGATGAATDPTGMAFTGKVHAYVEGYADKADGTKDYYDLDCADVKELKIASGTTLDISSGRITLAEAKSIFGDELTGTASVSKLTLNVPSYVEDKNEIANNATLAKIASLSHDMTESEMTTAKFTFTVAAPNYDPAKKYEDQAVELKVTNNLASDHDPSLGHVKNIKLTIAKEPATAKGATYTLDEKDAFTQGTVGTGETAWSTTNSVYYDGAEHTIAQATIPGVTTTYELYNNETGKYETVSGDAVVVKNVKKYEIKATAKDSKGDKWEHNITVDVKASTMMHFGFDKNDARTIYDNASSTDFEGFYVGSKYDPKDFVSTVPYKAPTTGATDAEKAKAAAAAKAVKADKEQIMAFFGEKYEFTTEESKYQEGIFNSEISEKVLTAVEKKALNDKYEELLANYKDTTSSFDVVNATTQFFVKDEVTFTKAPLNKTFKAKNGKLAKKKTFTVKAKALSGAKVTYKLANGGSQIVINKNTGKVTCKKGLKKRTYNVKITATAGKYIGTTNSFTVKIKVK